MARHAQDESSRYLSVEYPPSYRGDAPRGRSEVSQPSPEAMALVQSSLKAVADRPVALTERFYDHLFAMAPQVREMFPADMTAQTEKLCRSLLAVIKALSRPGPDVESVHLLLHTLGAQHAQRYGAVAAHYPYVGRALVRAVGDLSRDWSPAVSSAWVWVYEWVAAQMIAGVDDTVVLPAGGGAQPTPPPVPVPPVPAPPVPAAAFAPPADPWHVAPPAAARQPSWASLDTEEFAARPRERTGGQPA